MAAVGPFVGVDAKLYLDASGVGGSSWVEVTNVRDVGIPMDAEEADATTRADGGWKTYLQGLRDAGLEFEMLQDATDTTMLQAIRTAYLNGSVIGMAAMDQAIATAGAQGLQCDMIVTGFSPSQPLSGTAVVAVTMKPAKTTNTPDWATTSA